MIGEAEVFIGQGIDIGGDLLITTSPAVLEHVLYDGIGTFAMLDDLVFVFSNVFRDAADLFQVPFINLLIQFLDQLGIYLRKVIDEIQWVLDLVSDTGCQFSQGGHLFGVNQLRLCFFQFVVSLFSSNDFSP